MIEQDKLVVPIIIGLNNPDLNGVRPSVRDGRPGEKENLYIPLLPREVVAEYARVDRERTRSPLAKSHDVVTFGPKPSELVPPAKKG